MKNLRIHNRKVYYEILHGDKIYVGEKVIFILMKASRNTCGTRTEDIHNGHC
jgi:hypothetical protein